MSVKIAKEFHWEMGHRLPFHETCRNIHGHSYRLVVEVEGDPSETGMVVDFGEIGCLVKPILNQLDHSFMVDPLDELMNRVLTESQLKATRVPFPSTAENIAIWIADQVSPGLLALPNVSCVSLKVYETATSSAEVKRGRN